MAKIAMKINKAPKDVANFTKV